MKRSAPTENYLPPKRPCSMKRSPAQIFHKRPAPPLYAPAKRMRIEPPANAPPQMNRMLRVSMRQKPNLKKLSIS